MRKNRRNGLRWSLVLLMVSALAIIPSSAQKEGPLYLKAKKIYTSDRDQVFLYGGILIQGGKILKVEKKANPPKNARVIDLKDKVVIPGLIDSHCYAGFHEEDHNVLTEPQHPNPYSPVFPAAEARVPEVEIRYRASQAIFYGDKSFKKLLASGLTTVKIAIPSESLVAGNSACVKLGTPSPSEFILKETAGAEFSLIDPENVMRRYGDLKKTFLDAIEYRKNFEKYKKDLKKYQEEKAKPADEVPKEPVEPKKNENLEIILQILDRKLPAMIRASRIHEIQAAIEIAKEFNIILILVGGHEAYKVADDLALKNIPVIAGPGSTVMKKGELINYIGLLLKKNVPVAYGTRSNTGSIFLPFHLAYGIQHGLTINEALRVLTANAARILGIADRVGSISVGRDADLVVLNGEPFDLNTRVSRVYVSGYLAYSEE